MLFGKLSCFHHSFLLHLVLAENNSNTASRKMANVISGRCWLWKHPVEIQAVTFNCQRIQCRLHKAQHRTSTVHQIPEMGIFWTGKQTNHKTCPEILTSFFLFLFWGYFCAKKSGAQNTSNSYQKTGLPYLLGCRTPESSGGRGASTPCPAWGCWTMGRSSWRVDSEFCSHRRHWHIKLVYPCERTRKILTIKIKY